MKKKFYKFHLTSLYHLPLATAKPLLFCGSFILYPPVNIFSFPWFMVAIFSCSPPYHAQDSHPSSLQEQDKWQHIGCLAKLSVLLKGTCTMSNPVLVRHTKNYLWGYSGVSPSAEGLFLSLDLTQTLSLWELTLLRPTSTSDKNWPKDWSYRDGKKKIITG